MHIQVVLQRSLDDAQLFICERESEHLIHHHFPLGILRHRYERLDVTPCVARVLVCLNVLVVSCCDNRRHHHSGSVSMGGHISAVE